MVENYSFESYPRTIRRRKKIICMPRRSILSTAERENLLALPDTQEDLIRHYTFSESDLSLIRQRRGNANRFGFAMQLCLLRYPGHPLSCR